MSATKPCQKHALGKQRHKGDGKKYIRQDSSKRSESEVNITDIMFALIKTDKVNCLLIITSDAFQLGDISRARPEELNIISMADRVYSIEVKQTALETLVDKDIAEFISLKDKIPRK